MNLKFDRPPLLDLEASDELSALAQTAALLRDHEHMIDPDQFFEALIARQQENPPLLGSGIALPHARTAAVREIVCVAARCAREIAFGPEEIPVRLIFMFGVPPDQVSPYLALTATLARRLRDAQTIAQLLDAETSTAFAELLWA